MKTITATSARSGLFSLIKDSVCAHQAYRITSKPRPFLQGRLRRPHETLAAFDPGVLRGVRKAKKRRAAGRFRLRRSSGPSRYEIRITRQARKDVKTFAPKLRLKLRDILVHAFAKDPYQGKRLLGDLAGSYSLRLTLKDRIVYSVDEDAKIVYIERARTHYGD